MNKKTFAQLSFSAIAVAVTAAVAAPTHAQLKPVTVAESAPAPAGDQRIRKTGFRLSQFNGFISTVCVKTDIETQRTGRVPINTSRVYTVRYRKLTGWTCHVRSDLTIPPDVHSRKFSRGEFKECLWSPDRIIYGKRPNGSQKRIS